MLYDPYVSHPTPTPRPLVVGTAGHIDHGKSRLVRTLTGTDPDRLPEEQARGMTIDLGFAHCAHAGREIAFVDVPGHERFVRNMLAGATGVDAALLVVAADDSVMPQTREHGEILALLGAPRVVKVISKIDLVDGEWADEVSRDVDRLLESLGIVPAGEVRFSAETGQGATELLDLLARLAAERDRVAADEPTWFRMPIDRAFTVAGRGTVVTGTVQHGAVARDDELELLPARQRVRVRDLQTHHEPRAAVTGRLRLAVNLAAVALESVSRGCTLATPGYLEPSTVIDVALTWLRMPGKFPRRTVPLRLHLATSEHAAELRLANEPESPTVRAAFAQIRLGEPGVAEHGQRFIVRDVSGTRTLGGGVILRPVARRWTTRRPAHAPGLATLRDGPPAERIAEVLRHAEWDGPSTRRLAACAGVRDESAAADLCRHLQEDGVVHLFEAGGSALRVHASVVAALASDVERRVSQYLAANPRLPGVPRSQWPAWMPAACPERFRAPLSEHLLSGGALRLAGQHVTLAHAGPELGPTDRALYEALLAELSAGAFQPPGLDALRVRTPKNARRIRELIDLGVSRGELVWIAEGLWMHADRWEQLRRTVVEAIRLRGPQTVADLRTLLGSSRKYMVPICERLDALGITKRQGDLRSLGPNCGD
mgnify:CR=1 FL=1